MPTTRSARDSLSKVQAATLVRFDSSRNEVVEPSPTVSVASAIPPSPVATRARTKRKSAEHASEPGPSEKKARKSQGAQAHTASPGKSILRPATFETNTRGLTLSPPTVPAPPSPSDACPATPLDGPPLSTPAATPHAAPTDTVTLPAELSFDFEEAKAHLVAADARFSGVFARLRCKPFQDLAQIDPFRTLAQSILGQQISWLAARSITYKFVRLFNPHLPETRPERAEETTGPLFPTAAQVAATPVATLRTAGLSARKAEYVRDLAARFADGRLSASAIRTADDDALAELLIAVRGVGRWTVDMFALFALRRPDILPVGDLGVQKGLARWALARHAPQHAFTLRPDAVEQGAEEDAAGPTPGPRTRSRASTPVPAPAEDAGEDQDHALAQAPPRGSSPDASSVPPPSTADTPTPRRSTRTSPLKTPQREGLPALPTPFTASISRVLAGADEGNEDDELPSLAAPLPMGLTVAGLKARLDGKKKIKGAILTPAEMEALTETWRPYRSIGVYYMWALADADKPK